MYVDLGVDSREEVENLGVEIGNMVCFASECIQMNNEKVYAGKAMDDRSGCYVISEALKGCLKNHYDLMYICVVPVVKKLEFVVEKQPRIK